MAKIESYQQATQPLSFSDMLIGTDVLGPIPNATKNFSLTELYNLFATIPNVGNLQDTLNVGNSATQDIFLSGIITCNSITPTFIEDYTLTTGIAGQFLQSSALGIIWATPSVPNLQSVLNSGNTATQNILLTGNISLTKVIPLQIQDSTSSTGSVGQSLFVSVGGLLWANPATVTSIATSGLISGGPITTTGTISTSMTTNRLVGRGTSGTGVMEEIILGTNLSLTGTTLNATSGGVTSVTGTFPISSSGGATPAISMLQSSSITDGYLSSIDWTTFNSKGSGTVTSVATAGLISGGAITTTGTVTTSMNTNKLVGRSTIGTGIMEEITVGTGLSLSAGTLTASGASPLTTKGDLYTYDTTNARLPVGLDTQILLADSSTTTGLKWGTNTAATPLGYYGAFQDLTNQYAAVINTGYPMLLGVTDLTNGVTVVSSSRITIANTGIYNIQWSGQFTNPLSAEHDVTVWLRKNGVDVPGSAGIVLVPKRHGTFDGHTLPSWNFLLDVVGGDYYEFVWSTENISVYLSFTAAGSPPPSTASVVLTVTQQSGIMAGTGITAINSLTGAVQTMAAGTSGTDFAVSSVGTTHTLNLPSSSAINRGALTAADWTTFNNKGSGTVTSVSGTLNRIDSTGGATPVIDISATYVGQTSITKLGTIGTGVWNGTTIAIANGGTGQVTNTLGFDALSPTTTRGDTIVRGAVNNQRLALGTVGKILRSDGTDLVYTTATYPTTTTVSTLLYSSAANVISALATANNGVLVTSATGVPSISSALTYVATTGILTNTLSINSVIQIGATNVNTGVSTFIQLLANNGTYNFALQQLGTGYATSGLVVANQSRLLSSSISSMLINTSVASVPIIFAVGGFAASNEVHRSTSSGIEFRVLLKSLIHSAANLMAGQITLVGGTLAITITGLTTSHRGMVTLVTANNVLATRSYQAVCTVNTITIRANTDTGLLNMADTSVLNYFIFLNN